MNSLKSEGKGKCRVTDKRMWRNFKIQKCQDLYIRPYVVGTH